MKVRLIFPVIFTLIIIVFFTPFFFARHLPIPSDTLIGLYHPFRDLYSNTNPRGIPYKNFLITDPIRQQYPWRKLSIDNLKRFNIPLWNPYSTAGMPLLANIQSSVFYPLNIILFLLPFQYGWSILVFFQPLLSGLFLYYYLRNLEISEEGSFLSSITYAFSGFSIAWLEWNTIGHVALWLPLIFLSIDKILSEYKRNNYYLKNNTENSYIKSKTYFKWAAIFVFSLISSFYAGHLQTFFYLFIAQLLYFIVRWLQFGKNKKILLIYLILNCLYLIFSIVQWLPSLQLIFNSARNIDLNWQKPGWFIPWPHLIQFLIPDFFGNPSTLNYWGEWNYGEFIGYIGIFPLIMSLYAVFFRHDRKTLFFSILLFLSLSFSLPTIFAKIPYILQIPLLSSSQPTRLLFISDFALAVLAGFGLDFLQNNQKKINYILIILGGIFIVPGIAVSIYNETLFNISNEHLEVAKRNSIFPILIFILCSFFIIIKKLNSNKKVHLIVYILFMITVFDLFRFAKKFTPFTEEKYLYPQTKTISFIRDNIGYNRYMSIDPRILPPNVSVFYKIQSIDGYDPLYLLRYGELIASSERNNADISSPFGFNRIINPSFYNSKIINLLGVKYILSLSDINNTNLKKVFQEGQTKVYENTLVSPRAFFVENIEPVNDRNSAIAMLYKSNLDINKTAVIERSETLPSISSLSYSKAGKVNIISYNENEVILITDNKEKGFLVLTDTYYPTWKVKIINDANRLAVNSIIYRVNYNFRGIIVPAGKNKVVFYNSLFPNYF